MSRSRYCENENCQECETSRICPCAEITQEKQLSHQEIANMTRHLVTQGWPENTARMLSTGIVSEQQDKPQEEVDLKPEDFKGNLWSAIRKVKRKTGEP